MSPAIERASSRTAVLTVAALCAFAANSVLCRMALDGASIDAASFTTLRLLSGALLLAPLAPLAALAGSKRAGSSQGRTRRRGPGEAWLSASLLFVYAAAFSFAYLELAAGTGALLLFGAVQLTMVGVALARGERPTGGEWIGLAMAVSGLCWLVAPGVRAPDPRAALLMTLAGVAWGGYSLLGAGATAPTRRTAGNFMRAIPLAVSISGVSLLSGIGNVTPEGATLSVISGALTSGLGYVVWYAALPALGATRAATVQLAVPALAACGGIVLLGETPSLRLLGGGLTTLGGIAIAIRSRRGRG